MSEKRGPPPTSPAYPTGPPSQVVSPGAPPSYAESLTHPVVAGPPGVQYHPYPPGAVAPSVPLQKDQIFAHSGQWYLADPILIQDEYRANATDMMHTSAAELRNEQIKNMVAAQQAQKVAMSQQAAYQQQQAALYLQQQQQAMYLQQIPGYYQQSVAAAAAAAQPTYQPGQSVLVMNGYDSGARFDGVAQPSIPPPPPGVAPNAAQLAAASNAQVLMTQKKNSFLSGGSGGGYTFW